MDHARIALQTRPDATVYVMRGSTFVGAFRTLTDADLWIDGRPGFTVHYYAR